MQVTAPSEPVPTAVAEPVAFTQAEMGELLNKLNSYPQPLHDVVMAEVSARTNPDAQEVAHIINDKIAETEQLRAAIARGEDPLPAPGMQEVKQALLKEREITQQNAQAAQMLVGVAVGSAVASPPVLVAVAEPEEERPHGVTAARMPVRDLGRTTAAIAAIGEFVPQADLPNLKERSREQTLGMA